MNFHPISPVLLWSDKHNMYIRRFSVFCMHRRKVNLLFDVDQHDPDFIYGITEIVV